MPDFVQYVIAIVVFIIPLCIYFYKKKTMKNERNKINKDLKNLKEQCLKSKFKGCCEGSKSMNTPEKVGKHSGNDVLPVLDPKQSDNRLYNQQFNEHTQNVSLKYEEVETFEYSFNGIMNSNEIKSSCFKSLLQNCPVIVKEDSASDIGELRYGISEDKVETPLLKYESEIKEDKYDQVFTSLSEHMDVMDIFEDDNCSLQESIKCLKETIEELNNSISSKDEEFQIEGDILLIENTELKSSNTKFEKITKDQLWEIKSIKENESFLNDKINTLRNAMEELNSLMFNKEEEFNLKLRNMDSSVIYLQNTIEHLEKIIKEKTCEVEYLKNNNVPLLETVSFNHEVKEMKRRLLCKEEEFATKYKALEENNNFLKVIIEERDKDIDSKTLEIDNWKKNEVIMNEKVSSLTLSIEDLKKSKPSKEEIKNEKKTVKSKKNKNCELIKLQKNNKECYENNVEKKYLVNEQNIWDLEFIKKANIYLSKKLSSMKVAVEEYKNNWIMKEKVCDGIEINVSKVEKLLQEINILLKDVNRLQEELTKNELSRTEDVEDLTSEESFINDHEVIFQIFHNLEKQWFYLNGFKYEENGDFDVTFREENKKLKYEIDKYRDSLEKTEQMLERIQVSVEKEECKWTSALECSEQDCFKLEMKVKDLMMIIDDLKLKENEELNNTSDNAVVLNNSTLTHDGKKKRKHKNRKKANKHAQEPLNL